MSSFKKILMLLIGATVLMVTGCSEDFPGRTSSPETDPNCNQVFFPNSNVKMYELELEATNITITVKRLKTDNSIVVPLKVIRNDESIFVLPQSVSFGAGDSEVSFDVTFPNAELAKAYAFEIVIEGDVFVDNYTSIDGAHSLAVQIERIKWEKFAEGIYTSDYFGDSWPQALYKAYGTNKYRFFDLWVSDYNWDFFWEGGAAIIPVQTKRIGDYYVSDTGYLHSVYGMVSVHTDSDTDYTYFDEESDTFVFDRRWMIPDGRSFGWIGESYQITEYIIE